MNLVWAGLGHFYAYRGAREKRRTCKRWLMGTKDPRSTRRYLRGVRRYERLKKTSEKFFARVKGWV